MAFDVGGFGEIGGQTTLKPPTNVYFARLSRTNRRNLPQTLREVRTNPPKTSHRVNGSKVLTQHVKTSHSNGVVFFLEERPFVLILPARSRVLQKPTLRAFAAEELDRRSRH